MKILLVIFLFLAEGNSQAYAQNTPYIQWQKCLGGIKDDEAYSIQQTPDGGFIVAGVSGSNDNDVSGNHGLDDYWIVKLDSEGNIIWEKSLGGSITDEARCIQQTKNGGYIVAGISNSNDQDVSGNHGLTDYWIVNLDSVGNLVWQKSFGGSDFEEAFSIQQTSDGGFIVAGYTNSNDSDVSGNHGLSDYWIVKLDSMANLLWQKCFGGSDDDFATSVLQTADGGFVVAGETYSMDGDISGNHGSGDYWVIKLDTVGNLEWQKCLGGTEEDYSNSIQQTPDGEFIVSGYSLSNDGDVSGNHGADYWIVKIGNNGSIIWQKCLGGSQQDFPHFIRQTNDGGFVIAGRSFSDDGDVSVNHRWTDYWVAKTDSIGNLVWQKSLGGSDWDEPYAIQQTADGGFIVAGWTHSNDGDISGYHGSGDYWIVKIAMHFATGIVAPVLDSISIFPNPVQTKLFINLEISPSETTIFVYDLHGRIISLPTIFNYSQAEIATEKLPEGFYILQIINNRTGGSEFAKFVKE